MPLTRPLSSFVRASGLREERTPSQEEEGQSPATTTNAPYWPWKPRPHLLHEHHIAIPGTFHSSVMINRQLSFFSGMPAHERFAKETQFDF